MRSQLGAISEKLKSLAASLRREALLFESSVHSWNSICEKTYKLRRQVCHSCDVPGEI
jgi:hypothetical protein